MRPQRVYEVVCFHAPQFLRIEGHDMNIFIGLEVSLGNTAICVLGPQGKVVEELEAASEPEALLRARAQLRAELAELDAKIADLAKQDDVCRLMTTMPGVGRIVALTVKSAIDDPTRFVRSKDVGPWVGLTPRRTQSGEMDIVGQITRAGDRALRMALYQAAMILMLRGSPNWLQAWALKVAHRRGSKRALIALARRIGVVLHRMGRDGTPFRHAQSSPAAV